LTALPSVPEDQRGDVLKSVAAAEEAKAKSEEAKANARAEEAKANAKAEEEKTKRFFGTLCLFCFCCCGCCCFWVSSVV
jgi:hypothetical protein